MKLADTMYVARSVWGPRAETPEVLARRFLDLIARLKKIDPIFADWYVWTSGTMIEPLATEPDQLAKDIADSVPRDEHGAPEAYEGYYYAAWNEAEKEGGPQSFCAEMQGGRFARYPTSSNSILFRTDYYVEPDPRIISYSIFRSVVLALAESFNAVWCSAYSSEIKALWQHIGRPHFRLAWISYVGPRFSSLITPPKTAIVEHRPDGGLLMAATDEPFTIANPIHLAAARDIEKAIAPLNALPWPLDDAP
jgi:hypothetical protein